MSMTMDLKPCPFCGGASESDSQRGYRNMTTGNLESAAAIYCTSCNADMTWCYRDTPEIERDQVMKLLIEQWNTRAAILASGLVMAGTSTTDPIVRAAFDALNVAAPAVENLACNQEQCDFDGVMVKVSRQALDEVLTAINEVALVLAKAKLASGFVTAERPNESAIRADERERCARVAEDMHSSIHDHLGSVARNIAAAIRAGRAE